MSIATNYPMMITEFIDDDFTIITNLTSTGYPLGNITQSDFRNEIIENTPAVNGSLAWHNGSGGTIYVDGIYLGNIVADIQQDLDFTCSFSSTGHTYYGGYDPATRQMLLICNGEYVGNGEQIQMIISDRGTNSKIQLGVQKVFNDDSAYRMPYLMWDIDYQWVNTSTPYETIGGAYYVRETKNYLNVVNMVFNDCEYNTYDDFSFQLHKNNTLYSPKLFIPDLSTNLKGARSAVWGIIQDKPKIHNFNQRISGNLTIREI